MKTPTKNQESNTAMENKKLGADGVGESRAEEVKTQNDTGKATNGTKNPVGKSGKEEVKTQNDTGKATSGTKSEVIKSGKEEAKTQNVTGKATNSTKDEETMDQTLEGVSKPKVLKTVVTNPELVPTQNQESNTQMENQKLGTSGVEKPKLEEVKMQNDTSKATIGTKDVEKKDQTLDGVSKPTLEQSQASSGDIPRRLILPTWIAKSNITCSVPGLEFLTKLPQIYIFPRVTLLDELMDKYGVSKHMHTIRNEDFQKVYYVAPARKSKPHKYRAFKQRIIDQFGRHVLTVEKPFCWPLFREQSGTVTSGKSQFLGRFQQVKFNVPSLRYKVFKGQEKEPTFIVEELQGKRNDIEFHFLRGGKQVGKVCKRHEKLFTAAKETYVRLAFADDLDLIERGLLLALALVIKVIHFEKERAIEL